MPPAVALLVGVAAAAILAPLALAVARPPGGTPAAPGAPLPRYADSDEAHSSVATIHNDVPRVDTEGNIVNAHDGSLMRHNGTFYLFGTVYEQCVQRGLQCTAPCGYNPNRFAVYTSPDLMSWTLANDNVLPSVMVDNNKTNYWMPVVAFNPSTATFVMQYWSSACGFRSKCANVAVSASPLGPFEALAPMDLVAVPSSQMGMFVDYAGSSLSASQWIDTYGADGGASVTGTAYVKYNTAGPNQMHIVQELDPSWTATTGRWAVVFPKSSFPWNEGGGLFKRNGLYYYQTGNDCCFCAWGGDVKVWTARSALGPWHPGVLQGAPTAGTFPHADFKSVGDDNAAAGTSSELCDMSGAWTCVSSGTSKCAQLSYTVTQPGGGGSGRTAANFTVSGSGGAGSVQADGYVYVPGVAPLGRPGVVTSADGKSVGCDRVRWYGDEEAHWCREGASCATPSTWDPMELNWCADGSRPAYGPSSVPQRVNPCSPGDPLGTNYTVPAQQFNVLVVSPGGVDYPTADAMVIYYGERSKSAPDDLKANNYQAWVPQTFHADGTMGNLSFPPSFEVPL